MNILFDKGSSQVQVQLETNNRLNTLFGALDEQGWSYSIGPDRIDAAALEGVDGLVILTRHKATQPGTTNPFPPDWDFAYTSDELDAITAFVQNGHGLLLISNHGPFRPGDTGDWTVNDRVLAARLGITINPASYQSPTGKLTISGSDFSADPIIQQTILDGVGSIIVHNSCAVSGGTPIAIIPPNSFNNSPLFPNGPEGQSYAVLTSGNCGSVIVAGNSGLAGDAGSPWPGPGLIDEPDNKQFLLNAIRYVTSA